MESDTQEDGDQARHEPSESAETILEALLVDDAEVLWDPVTGRPHVGRRPKPGLDSPPGSE